MTRINYSKSEIVAITPITEIHKPCKKPLFSISRLKLVWVLLDMF